MDLVRKNHSRGTHRRKLSGYSPGAGNWEYFLLRKDSVTRAKLSLRQQSGSVLHLKTLKFNAASKNRILKKDGLHLTVIIW